jgi:hypothetical protein
MKLGANEKNFLVVRDDPAIVSNILVRYWHANIQQDVLADRISENHRQALPSMQICI